MSASISGGVIVFLDIDGVLLPFGSNAAAVEPPALFDDACLSALSALLALRGNMADEATDAKTNTDVWAVTTTFFRMCGAAHHAKSVDTDV